MWKVHSITCCHSSILCSSYWFMISVNQRLRICSCLLILLIGYASSSSAISCFTVIIATSPETARRWETLHVYRSKFKGLYRSAFCSPITADLVKSQSLQSIHASICPGGAGFGGSPASPATGMLLYSPSFIMLRMKTQSPWTEVFSHWRWRAGSHPACQANLPQLLEMLCLVRSRNCTASHTIVQLFALLWLVSLPLFQWRWVARHCL